MITRGRRIFTRFVAFTLIVAGCLLAAGIGCANSFLLPANHETIDPHQAGRRIVKVDGRIIECWIARSPAAERQPPAVYMLFFVGKGDRADRWIGVVAQTWGDHPVEAWGMNYPGSGGSQGPPEVSQVGADALGVFDAMRREAAGRPIFIQAGSFGTTVALCVAARRPVAGVIIQNPPPLRQLILGHYGWWNLWLIALPVACQVPADLDSIANGQRCTAPAIFILSGADEIIPHKYHLMVSNAYAGPKRIINIPGARHSDPLPHEAAVSRHEDMEWLWKLAKEKSPQMDTDEHR